MPSPDTFSVKPIGEFVQRYLAASKVSIDPFARDKRWATHTNDLNPKTAAEHHLDAEEFLRMLAGRAVLADLVIFDPPYSPRQISECYKEVGREVGMSSTQNGALYKQVRDAIVPVLAPEAVVLSFGWNSAGMGVKRGGVRNYRNPFGGPWRRPQRYHLRRRTTHTTSGAGTFPLTTTPDSRWAFRKFPD